MAGRLAQSAATESGPGAVRPRRLAAVTSHPVQYQAPLFQQLARASSVDLTVFYGHNGSITGELDPEFGVPVAWDRPLLDGYRHVFLTDRAKPAGRLRSLVRQAAVIRPLCRGRYDAVFIHSYATPLSLLAYVGAWLSRTPVLLRTESHAMQPRSLSTRLAKRVVLRALFRFTNGFLVIGKGNRRFYESYGVESSRMFWTPYSVDNDYFTAQEQRLRSARKSIREDLGLPVDAPVVVYSGKLIARKRVEDLLHAAHELSARGRPASVVIVGDGPLRDSLTDLSRSLNVHTIFAGFQNQSALPRYYACGDVFVLPSNHETWGLVINEAMSFGMPVVTTSAVGAGVDLVIPGVTGYVYETGDRSALASCLAQLLGNDEQRALMGAAARRLVGEYSLECCVEGVIRAVDFARASLPSRASEGRSHAPSFQDGHE